MRMGVLIRRITRPSIQFDSESGIYAGRCHHATALRPRNECNKCAHHPAPPSSHLRSRRRLLVDSEEVNATTTFPARRQQHLKSIAPAKRWYTAWEYTSTSYILLLHIRSFEQSSACSFLFIRFLFCFSKAGSPLGPCRATRFTQGRGSTVPRQECLNAPASDLSLLAT